MNNTPDIPGAKEVTDWFGVWPSFHDAEIISLDLHRSESSKLQLKTSNMTTKTENGFYVLEKNALVSFTMHNVSNLELSGFSIQNVIGSLFIEKLDNGFRITLNPCYGLNGYLDAEQIIVSFEPCTQNVSDNI